MTPLQDDGWFVRAWFLDWWVVAPVWNDFLDFSHETTGPLANRVVSGSTWFSRLVGRDPNGQCFGSLADQVITGGSRPRLGGRGGEAEGVG